MLLNLSFSSLQSIAIRLFRFVVQIVAIYKTNNNREMFMIVFCIQLVSIFFWVSFFFSVQLIYTQTFDDRSITGQTKFVGRRSIC